MIFLTFWVYHFLSFFQGSGSLEPIQNDVFWCPEGPGTIPDWFPIDLGNIIFSSKFSFFGPLMSTYFHKNSYVEARGKPSTWLPREELLEQIQRGSNQPHHIQPINLSINQLQASDQPSKQASNNPTNQPANQSTQPNQPTNWPTNPPIQPTSQMNEPTNQTHQSMHRGEKYDKMCFHSFTAWFQRIWPIFFYRTAIM